MNITKTFLKYSILFVWLTVAAAYWLAGFVDGEENADSKHHGLVAESYDFRFGKDKPFAPSNADTFNSRFIDPKAFISSARCAACHTDIHPQWSESAHAKSFVEPFYQKNVIDLQNQKNIAFTRHCESCHNPAALFSGALTDEPAFSDRSFDQDGVSCIACHSIESVSGRGVGGYVMGQPALIQQTDGTKIVDATDEDIINDIEGHKRALMRDLLRKPEFCSSCHKSQVPKELNDYKFLRAFMVGDEYQRSSFSKESPHPFYEREKETCNSCHMKKVPTLNYDVSVKEDTIVSHRFAAANTAIPLVYGYKKQFEEVVDFLQDDKIGVDIFALHRQEEGSSKSKAIIPLNRNIFRIKAGDTLTADVVVTNKNIGHSFPPELRDFYEAFIEFEVTDSNGSVMFSSGHTNPDGFVDKTAHDYKTYLLYEDGKLNDLHHIWRTRVVGQNNQIQSGRSDVTRYRFKIPDGFEGELVLTAKMQYRRFTKVFSDYVFGYSEKLPIVTMATAQESVKVGERTMPVYKPDRMPDWWRWNNYGIALLDHKQYEAAADAFEKVIDSETEYRSRAFANKSLALIELGDWKGAEKLVDKSIRGSVDNYRSIYIRGLIHMALTRHDEAEKDFESVLKQFPFDRATLQQLGELWTIRSENAPELEKNQRLRKAIIYFERILDIDPEDLGATYNLMIIYQRLGERDLARRMSEEFKELKEDTQNGFLVSEFLQKNPEVGNESVSYHIHDLDRAGSKSGDPLYPTIPSIDWTRSLTTTADFVSGAK